MIAAAGAPHTLPAHGPGEPASTAGERAAGQQRQRVLGLLRSAPGPVDAQHVADILEIHVTTARFHLSTLESQGLVRRGTGARVRGAGRPRLTYEIAPRLDYADIVALFATHLGGDVAEREARAVRVGADLARRIKLTEPSVGGAAPDLVANALDELGFQVQSVVNALGTVTVRICTCPLAKIAADAPEVVRGIQRGLIQEVLDSNAPVLGCHYRVIVRPDPSQGACQVQLDLRRTAEQ